MEKKEIFVTPEELKELKRIFRKNLREAEGRLNLIEDSGAYKKRKHYHLSDKELKELIDDSRQYFTQLLASTAATLQILSAASSLTWKQKRQLRNGEALGIMKQAEALSNLLLDDGDLPSGEDEQ